MEILDRDYLLIECDREMLLELVEKLEDRYQPELVRKPSICLGMVRAEDSLEKQEFYLGEAVITDCEVSVGSSVGYGICLGEALDRAYCIAVIDAVISNTAGIPSELSEFFDKAREQIRSRENLEAQLVAGTKVDFKLFEEE